MRKCTIRSGMRLVLASLVVIILTSFYSDRVGEILSLSYDAELRLYQLGIFCAAAMGGYGVVLTAFGLILTATRRDTGVRVMPSFLMIVAVVFLFFYLLAASFNSPANPERQHPRPGENITI
jgi:hypothetical protein